MRGGRAGSVHADGPAPSTLASAPSLFPCPSRVVAATLMIGFHPNPILVVVATFPRGHVIHTRDLVGLAFIAAGILVLWHAPIRR